MKLYIGAEAAVVVYDITNRSSFDEATRFVDSELELQDVVVLVGNKEDLSWLREVKYKVIHARR